MPGMRNQPQSLARINRDGLGRGVKMLLMPQGGGLVDVATGKQWLAVGNVGFGNTPHGRAAIFNGVNSARFEATGYEDIVGNTGTFFIWMPRVGPADQFGAIFLTNSAGSVYFQLGASNDVYLFGNAGITGAGTNSVFNSRNRSLVLSAAGTAASKRAYVNGVSVGTPNATAPSAFAAGSKTMHFGGFGGGNSWDSNADVVIAGFTSEVWTAEQARQFYENPWQLFADPEDEDEFFLQAATGSSITVTPASLLLGGGEIAMRVSRRASVDPAAMAIGAVDVGLVAARRVGLQPVDMALAGGSVNLRAARTLAVNASSLALQPGSVKLRADRRLTVAPASMAVTGGTLEFVHTPAPGAGNYVMAITPAALSLAGGQVSMRISRRIAAAPVPLALPTGNVRLLAGYRTAVAPVALVVAGGQVLLRAAHRLKVEPAQLVATGGSVVLRYSQQIEYSRAPAGSGYSPQRVEVQARPAQLGGSRPASIQRNHR